MIATTQPILSLGSILTTDFLRLVVFIILSIYSLFALLIVRQVSLMSNTLITPVSSVVKFISIVHAGFAISLLVFIAGVI